MELVAPAEVGRALTARRRPFGLAELDWRAALAGDPAARDRLAGRLAVERVVARALARGRRPPAPVRGDLRNDARGAPVLELAGLGRGARRWSLSISHRAGHGAAALLPRRQGRVGVDLEVDPEPGRPLLRHFLAEDELRRLAAGKERVSALELWTLKEAILKAWRCGLDRSPRTLPLAWRRARSGGRGAPSASRPLVARPLHERDLRTLAVCERRGGVFLAWAVTRGRRSGRPAAATVPGVP